MMHLFLTFSRIKMALPMTLTHQSLRTHDRSLISKPIPYQTCTWSKAGSSHPNIFSNHTPVETASHQKHLGIYFDEKINTETVLCNVNKGISMTKKLRRTLPRKSLLIIYKAFLRPHID